MEIKIKISFSRKMQQFLPGSKINQSFNLNMILNFAFHLCSVCLLIVRSSFSPDKVLGSHLPFQFLAAILLPILFSCLVDLGLNAVCFWICLPGNFGSEFCLS